MLLWILRGIFGITVIGMATAAGLLVSSDGASSSYSIASFGIVLLVGVAALAVDVCVRNKQITTISAVYFGLLLGLLLGTLFSLALKPLVHDYFPPSLATRLDQLQQFLIVLVCCYVSVTTLLQT